MAKTKFYWIVAEVDRNNAGYRIRTLPIVEELKRVGVKSEIVAVKDFPAKVTVMEKDAHTVIVSKPSDTASFLCIKYLQDQGVRIVVDLFDNYFSWSPSLFYGNLQWHWLRAIKRSSLVIVSTPFLAKTVRLLGVSDAICIGDVVPELSRKKELASLKKWGQVQTIELLWFGINANPYFYAGLDDLISWVNVVGDIQDRLQGRLKVRLTICTKAVKEVEAAILTFRNQGIEAKFVPWTEERCGDLLTRSHVVLLPSNLSAFSLSKTHNRCSDALARYCLVVASPNGPYKDIPGAVFRSVSALCGALESLSVKEIKSKVEESFEYLMGEYDIEHTVSKLLLKLKFNSLAQVGHDATLQDDNYKFLVAGITNISNVKLSRTLGYLVCHFTGTPQAWNFDFLLQNGDPDTSTIFLKLSAKGVAAVESRIGKRRLDSTVEAECWEYHGWNVSLDKALGVLTIQSTEFAERLELLRHMAAVGTTNPVLYRRWIDVNVGLLSLILIRLGFTNIELAADKAGGWEQYAEVVDPVLSQTFENLERLWLRYPGNEAAWMSSEEKGVALW